MRLAWRQRPGGAARLFQGIDAGVAGPGFSPLQSSSAADLWFVLILAAYFAAHAALRTLLGGALEVDEAEMILAARGWHLGYGPQLPLYNWLQVASFSLFGVTTFALAGLKNAVLFLAYAFLYAGLRAALPLRLAVAGTLAVALLPNVLWEFQRASTHSIAMLATVTGTIAATIWVLQRTSWQAYLWLGIVVGLGGLAKFNFWFVPGALVIAIATDPQLRRRIVGLRLLASGAIAIAVLAVPYLWIIRHPTASFGSAYKLYLSKSALPAFAEGIGSALGNAAVALVLVLGVAALFRPWNASTQVAWPARLLLRAGAIAVVMLAVGIVATGVSSVLARWLVPVLCLVAPGLMIWAARDARANAIKRLCFAVAGLGIVTLVGMAELRVNGRKTGGIEFAPLADRIAALAPLGTPIVAGTQIGGNLVFLRPELNVAELNVAELRDASAVAQSRQLVVLWGGAQADPIAQVRALGIEVRGARVVDAGLEELGYRDAPGSVFPVHWALVALAR